MAAAKKEEAPEMVTVTAKKADSVCDGNGGFVDEGGKIEVTKDCADSLKDKGLI